MKPILLTFLLMLFFAVSFYSISHIASKHTPLSVKTNQKLISIHHTKGDTFKVDLFVNTKHSMYVYEEAMARHRLRSEDETVTLPISLTDYAFGDHGEDQFKISLTYELDIEDASESIQLKDAYLAIFYTDDTRLSIPIGEFTYHFENTLSNGLDYTSSTPIKGDYGHGATVVGQCIGLVSKSDSNLLIQDITLFSSHIQPNSDYMVEYSGPINPLMDLETILRKPFNPKNTSVAPLTLTLPPGEETTVCIPFATTKDLTVERYPINIDYREAHRNKALIIDDFTYAHIAMNPINNDGVMRHGTFE